MRRNRIVFLFVFLLASILTPIVHAADVTIVALGDMVCENADINSGCRQISRNLSSVTSSINPSYFLALGDLQYVDGSLSDFNNKFNADWGTLKSIMRPVPGNHEYQSGSANGYFTYFGSQATGVNGKGYYSWNAGDWHMIALNSETAISEQVTWLRNDLAANTRTCTLAYFHRPRFSSGSNHGSDSTVAPFWTELYNAYADVVLSGHEHNYERFRPQSPSGAWEASRGIREFVVGTGGRSFYGFNAPIFNSEFTSTNTGGVLRMVLHPTSYDFAFINQSGQVIDSGSGQCVTSSGSSTPTHTPGNLPTQGPTATRTPTPTVPPATACGTLGTAKAEFATTLPAGTYNVWSRIKSSGSAKRFGLQIGSSACALAGSATNVPNWTWTSLLVSLSSSSPTISLLEKDPGLLIDKVIVTSNLSCVPQDNSGSFGENCATAWAGDVNSSGIVDIFDFNIVTQDFGRATCNLVGDANNDCTVNRSDIGSVVSDFGKR